LGLTERLLKKHFETRTLKQSARNQKPQPMNWNHGSVLKLTLTAALGFFAIVFLGAAADKPKPNFVIIFTDDQGYQDVGCFGSPDIQTPNLDRMAAEGVRFTDFYVGQPVCSASRAALMTGCFPCRVGILGALGPKSKIGINANEKTIAEVLKPRGYATAIYGKWHLGDSPQFLPTHHGFDEYFGLPYSNDMWPKHPSSKFPDLPLIEGDRVVQYNPDQHFLTTWYTEHAVDFIHRNKDGPFFLYVAHNMPHVPLHVSDKFAGKSKRGLYGDVIMEIDWSVGRILQALKDCGIDDRTMVVFTSDNGPWLLYGDHAGRALPLREGKMTTFDGGVREPCIMRWPGKLPAGKVCHEMVWSMDLLPTFATLAGAAIPQDRIIDGRDIWNVVTHPTTAKTPHPAYFYYWNRELEAVRSGDWKLHFHHTYMTPDPPGHGGQPGHNVQRVIDVALFDLKHDIGEIRNVAAWHPDVVRRLEALAAKCREDLGDSATKQIGKNVRPPGRLEVP
jgi:arylsulfatase A-like enzyme